MIDAPYLIRVMIVLFLTLLAWPVYGWFDIQFSGIGFFLGCLTYQTIDWLISQARSRKSWKTIKGLLK